MLAKRLDIVLEFCCARRSLERSYGSVVTGPVGFVQHSPGVLVALVPRALRRGECCTWTALRARYSSRRTICVSQRANARPIQSRLRRRIEQHPFQKILKERL